METHFIYPGPPSDFIFPPDVFAFSPLFFTVQTRDTMDNIYVITLLQDVTHITHLNNITMNTLINTWTKATLTDRLGLVIFATIMILLANVVVAWADNGFATYF